MNFKKIIPALTLLFALTIAFAFKPAVHKATTKLATGNVFVFIGTPGTGDEFDPNMYWDLTGIFDPADDADCPGHEVLCAVVTERIYTQADAPNPSFVGQPKVNLPPLVILIANTIVYQQDDPTNGIYLETAW